MGDHMSRQQLLLANQSLNDKGIGCDACVGECCTSRRNSMQITKSEALDIRAHLESQGLWNDKLLVTLRNNIHEYRLDVEVPRFGSRQNLRRTYTCPFYVSGPRGCSLPRSVKPFGCLAFNPTKANATGLDDGCTSDQELLAQLSSTVSADEKWPIPIALTNDFQKNLL